MSYQEFYCNPSTGSQMSGGYPESGGIYPYTKTNGNWSAVTGVFTPTAGNPQTDGVAVGDYASVYNDGATTPVFVGRVTARNATTITVDIATNKIGTAPTTSATARTITVGGSLKGPNAADPYPIGSFTSALTNASGNPTRINLKNNASYTISAGVTSSQSNVNIWGYSSTAGDGGKAVIDANANVITPLTISGGLCQVVDIEVKNNGASGSSNGIVVSTTGGTTLLRCAVHDIRGNGISITAGNTQLIECEAYLCNGSNTAGAAGFAASVNATCIRCIAHDNAGSNSVGFLQSSTSPNALWCFNCIADTNGSSGFKCSGSGSIQVINCDSYNNGGSGVDVNVGSNGSVVMNTNLIKNTSNGVTGSSSATWATLVINCGFGSGTQANAAATSGRGIQEIGSVTYATDVTPWVAPTTGDFDINLAAAIGAGRGAFTQTQASYTGAASAPVIGASQVADYPAQANVSNGVTYGNGAYTGSASAGSGASRASLPGGLGYMG